MKVTLKRNWNAPGDKLFQTRDNPVEVDEDLFPYLPSDAIVYNEQGKPIPRAETRTKVLLKRRELGLDKVTAELPQNEALSDEELLRLHDQHKPVPKPDPNAPEVPDAPKESTKAELQKLLKSAKERAAEHQKELEAAKTEPAKGVAKENIAKAQSDIEKYEALLEDAE